MEPPPAAPQPPASAPQPTASAPQPTASAPQPTASAPQPPASTPQQKSKNKPQAQRDSKTTPCPERPPVYVFKKKNKEGSTSYVDSHVSFRGVPLKSQVFQEVDNKRQASRTDFCKSLAQLAFKVKTVTNDDVFVAVAKSEKVKETGETVMYTTDKENFLFVRDADNPSVEKSPERSRSRQQVPPGIDARLIESSPSASRYASKKRIDTARSIKKSNNMHCANKSCGHAYKESDDTTDPWVGCLAWSDKKSTAAQRCDVWMHASCTGWFPRDNDEVEAMPDWYCKKHRKNFMPPRTTIAPRAKNQVASKVGKRSNAKVSAKASKGSKRRKNEEK